MVLEQDYCSSLVVSQEGGAFSVAVVVRRLLAKAQLPSRPRGNSNDKRQAEQNSHNNERKDPLQGNDRI